MLWILDISHIFFSLYLLDKETQCDTYLNPCSEFTLNFLCISSLESGARITTDFLITHFYTDALESISRSTQFDEDIDLAMVLRVSV